MDLTKEIAAAIDAHLPAAIGEQLRKRLDDAAKIDKENAKLRETVADLEGTREKLKAIIDKHSELTSREKSLASSRQDLDERTREVERREQAMATTLADERANAAERKAEAIYTLAEIALGKRSREERITRISSKDSPPHDQYGSTRTLRADETVEHVVKEVG